LTPLPADVARLYADQAARVRAHVAIRWRSCPFGLVAARVPPGGRILDYGCGHGAFAAWLALASPDRDVTGVDVDPDKIASASAAADAARTKGLPAPRFSRIEPGEIPAGPWDAVVLLDVLYLLPHREQERLLRGLARTLAPGSILLVKEVAGRPRWKALWNRVQETLAVRVLRITAGDGLRFLSPDRHAAWLSEEGLSIESIPADAGYLHSHHLIVSRRPGAPD